MKLRNLLGLLLAIGALAALVVTWGIGAVGSAAVGEYSCYCTQPQLRLTQDNVYWQSYADYSLRNLSVDYDISNDSTNYANAHNVKILGTINSPGTASVDHGRDINMVSAGECELVTVRYHVPAGTARFDTRVYATSHDQCGNSYEYPSAMP